MPLRTLAVDFNSFFASCEQQERPELRGKPLGIVPVLADTTCCIAASYAAKARGVKVGTGIAEARQLCPDIILVQQRPAVYIGYHRRLLAVIESCIHVTAIKSIDEMECDLTATFAPRERAVAVARQIKARIAREIGPCLTSSIGIAPNWLLAKMATDLQKPDGLVVLDDADLPGRLLGLQLRDFLGVGARMEARLRAHGIDTAAQLYAATKAELRGIWGGVEGERMHALLRGETIALPVERHQTIGHSHVLPPYLRTGPKAHAVLHRLLQKAAMRLRNIGCYAGALTLHLDYYDDVAWADELRLTETQDTLALTVALNRLWARRPAALRARAPMRVGVVLTRLLPAAGHTPDLFHQARDEARGRLLGAMDTLNRTYGNGSVYLGSAHGVTESAPMRISFTCIPEPELEEIDPRRERRVRPGPPPAPAAWSDN
ncbi:DNA polymerase IV [Lacunisphaera limnophila]|uniref:DNA polymerase IV n=1 Tax=Lacunisphaera limnophila TaxID=1838286 RepID=A0A1D8AYF1_9BACT|nr:DNA polymerase [Lacunisphaera limnophila]AOS45929.1 DNA polymerase IV [Lacunisphaera limnophila]